MRDVPHRVQIVDEKGPDDILKKLASLYSPTRHLKTALRKEIILIILEFSILSIMDTITDPETAGGPIAIGGSSNSSERLYVIGLNNDSFHLTFSQVHYCNQTNTLHL